MKKILCLLFAVTLSVFMTVQNTSFAADESENATAQEATQKNKKEKKIKAKDLVQSTQGIEINQNITKTLKKDKKHNKEVKKKKKKANDYIKHKRQQQNLQKKLKYKERELEFINHRSEIHHQRLEEYSNTETEKGDTK